MHHLPMGTVTLLFTDADFQASFPPLKTLDTHPNNLPVQLTPFIGREQELTAVQQLLRRLQRAQVVRNWEIHPVLPIRSSSWHGCAICPRVT